MPAAPQPRLQGLRERAVLLVVLGFVLLLPPFLLVVAHRTEAFGAPVFYVYIFVVWGGLIALNARLAHRLDDAARAAELVEAADMARNLGSRPIAGTSGGSADTGGGTSTGTKTATDTADGAAPDAEPPEPLSPDTRGR